MSLIASLPPGVNASLNGRKRKTPRCTVFHVYPSSPTGLSIHSVPTCTVDAPEAPGGVECRGRKGLLDGENALAFCFLAPRISLKIIQDRVGELGIRSWLGSQASPGPRFLIFKMSRLNVLMAKVPFWLHPLRAKGTSTEV